MNKTGNNHLAKLKRINSSNITTATKLEKAQTRGTICQLSINNSVIVKCSRDLSSNSPRILLLVIGH